MILRVCGSVMPGVIVEGGRGSVRGKVKALREAGVFVAETLKISCRDLCWFISSLVH